MSRGKYSVRAYISRPDDYEYKYNCYGKIAEPWTQEMIAAGEVFDDKTMFCNYDDEGFDQYGYSAFDRDGNFVGHGDGVDRAGWTEMDYLTLQDVSEDQRDDFFGEW